MSTTATMASTRSTREARVINFNNYHPGYSGTVRMVHYCFRSNQNFCTSANLDKLWTLVSKQTLVNAAKKKTGGDPIIDEMQPGYKVLGKEKLQK